MAEEVSIQAVSPELRVGAAVCAIAGAQLAAARPRPTGKPKRDLFVIKSSFLNALP
ncbi:hypothetical protein Aam_060_030 [Acidocella aminolytica 101 = DSM 11237]|uniref:Uncharacterized protein n=1 Tax=Acidocella aminolytica 101 = DSM 11237 TaxID=1120923 RepID=A0A0D6PJ08_9PROT|nr:hypothetical protein Aam_060_030 [Acidocella aminolytica 101 = DSM 11237]GBQ36391.1 hypothetical protein AA11237_1232 [Acidocella aminolytica 101 = DSM 11237]